MHINRRSYLRIYKRADNSYNVKIILVYLVLFEISCTTITRGVKYTDIKVDKSIDSNQLLFGWWKPDSINVRIYNQLDTTTFVNCMKYDSLFTGGDFTSALIHIKKDTLFEYLVNDSCIVSDTIIYYLTDGNVFFLQQPHLLGSHNLQDFRRSENLKITNGKLNYVLSVFFDEQMEKRIKQTTTTIQLTKEYSAFVSIALKKTDCNAEILNSLRYQ